MSSQGFPPTCLLCEEASPQAQEPELKEAEPEAPAAVPEPPPKEEEVAALLVLQLTGCALTLQPQRIPKGT